jgi:hypothetical protein
MRPRAGAGEPGADRVGAQGEFEVRRAEPDATNRATTGASSAGRWITADGLRPARAWYNPGVLFAQAAQPLTPLIVKVIDKPTKEISMADILMGSAGITVLFLVGAALLGFALGGLFILFRRWQDRRSADHASSDAFQLTRPPR